MTHLWAPWRSKYVQGDRDKTGCIFCHAAQNPDDKESLILFRGEFTFVLLNKYPYTTGHLMIAPYAHVSRLSQAGAEASAETMRLVRQAEILLERVYRPDGLNVGMNLGAAAGAGIEEHIHMHVLPRWFGDANFMTSVGETRVLPEALATTYARLEKGFSPE